MASDDVVYGLVVPLIGTILGWILSVAPIPHLINAEPTGKLGNLSPYPSVVFLGSSCTWFMYGCQRGLTFVILSSGVGSLILLFVVLRSHRLADSTLRFRMEALMFALLTLDMAYVLAFTAIKGDKLIIEDIVGSTAVTLNTTMFVVPLSSMWSILKRRDSSQIFLPWAAASTVCSLCWTLYGLLGVKDILVALPNIVGLALGCLQLLLRAVLPAKADAASAAEKAANAQAVATAAVVAPTPNPLAAARKLSASKYLLVRNDSYTEMRQQQQAQMAEQMAAPATPLPASTLAVEGASDDATTAVVASAVGKKEGLEEDDEGLGAGLVPVAAS